MLERHTNHEHDELELRRWCPEQPALGGRCQVGFLDRKTKVLVPIVSQNQLVMRVDVNQPARCLIVSEEVGDSRQLLLDRSKGPFEREPGQYCLKAIYIDAAHEQIKIVLPTHRSAQGIVTFPVAV